MKDISILVVEDEKDIREIMVSILSRKFSPIFQAEDGIKGYEAYKILKPDIIISDIHMPILDGLGMVEKIRLEDIDIPILLASAFNDQENLMKAINLGVDRFITKPLNIPLLHREMDKIAAFIGDRKAKKDYEEKMTLLTQAILHSKDAIAMFDQVGNLLFFNYAFCNLFSCNDAEMLKANAETIFYSNPDILKHIKNTADEEVILQTMIPLPDNLNAIFQLTLNQIFNTTGELNGTLLSFHDISSDLKNKHNLEIEKEKAIQSNKFKSDFLSTMSHDIRTPMNLIIGLTDLLIDEKPNESQLKHLQLIRKSGENLVHLVNDILDVSKIEAGKLEIEKITFDLKVALNYLINLFSEQAKKKNINFTIDFNNIENFQYIGDPYRLQQILINLIGNAFKFTEEGHITLSVSEKEKKDSHAILEFTVSDSGKGISAEYLPKIFSEYQQESAEITRKYGGTGLGTSIAKNLTHLMGGQISVVSPAKKIPCTIKNPGSEFTFTIKVDIPEKPDQTSGAEISDNDDQIIKVIRNARFNVLIAEDNSVNQLLLKNILNYFEVTADIASNGQETVKMAMSKTYHAIFMDIEMPGMTGIDAAIQLRKNKLKTPIIACTAHNFKEELEKYIQIGMDDYIVKPVNKKHVMKILENIFIKSH
ncbi:MAG: response regulator [Spirochaetia bacterium]|nr:response regulator [Spirochaetia bacterium]